MVGTAANGSGSAEGATNLLTVSTSDAIRKPVLAVDVDGVISLFGFDGPPEDAPCRFQLIDGMAHCISFEAGERLLRLIPHFELIWATGWEDRANEYLLHLLGLPEMPVLRFGESARFGTAHWKLDPIGLYASGRRLAWLDDSLDESCHRWAEQRAEPTLLVPTEPQIGLEEAHVDVLIEWAQEGADFERNLPDEVLERHPEVAVFTQGGARGPGERGGPAALRSLRDRFRRRLD